MKTKLIAAASAAIMAVAVFAGCSAQNGGASSSATSSSGGQVQSEMSGAITVISREDGSGTRGAFIELFGIEEKNDAGEKVDNTIASADQTNSTGVMLKSVEQDDMAIGYVSLGSLSDTVKALKIDGADATAQNVDNGTYKISRPFNIATKDNLSEIAKDFIGYIL